MIDIKVYVFTDNNEGRRLASRIGQLGFSPVFIRDSQLLSRITSEDNIFNILIVDLADVSKERITRLLRKYPLEGTMKLVILDECSNCSGLFSPADLLHLELFSRPFDERAFLLILEKIIFGEKYRRLMQMISAEAEIKIRTLEEFLSGDTDSPDAARERAFYVKIIEFEKMILEEHMRINDSIRRMSLLRNNEYMDMKDRIRAEELLGELRRQELMDARETITAQESLLDYSTQELKEARMILSARETVEELGRAEAIHLHEELDRLRSINSELEKRIQSLLKSDSKK